MKRLGNDSQPVHTEPPAVLSPYTQSPLPARRSVCLGDVFAVVFGVVVFCLGVIFWVSPAIGLFGGDSTGIQRLAVLTTTLGINTIAIYGLLLYSITQEYRRDGNRSRPTGYSETSYTTGEQTNPGTTEHRSTDHKFTIPFGQAQSTRVSDRPE